LRLAPSNGPNKVDVSFLHLKTETVRVSRALCVLVTSNYGRWTQSINLVILDIARGHFQNVAPRISKDCPFIGLSCSLTMKFD
jgi:hypothetical protein